MMHLLQATQKLNNSRSGIGYHSAPDPLQVFHFLLRRREKPIKRP